MASAPTDEHFLCCSVREEKESDSHKKDPSFKSNTLAVRPQSNVVRMTGKRKTRMIQTNNETDAQAHTLVLDLKCFGGDCSRKNLSPD